MNQVDVSSDVRFWSDYVILSKRIAVDENYYEDEFIKYFSPKGFQDSILSIGMFMGFYTFLASYARVVGIRTLVETFLSHFPDQTVQFVNLGAALDTTSLYLLSKYPNVVCFDLDLENEIRAKIDIITQTEELLSLFPNHKVDTLDFYSQRYHIFECDLRDLKNLQKLIDHGFSYDLPTIYLSEFVLTYLENHLSNEVLHYGVTLRCLYTPLTPKGVIVIQLFPYQTYSYPFISLITQHRFIIYSCKFRLLNIFVIILKLFVFSLIWNILGQIHLYLNGFIRYWDNTLSCIVCLSMTVRNLKINDIKNLVGMVYFPVITTLFITILSTNLNGNVSEYYYTLSIENFNHMELLALYFSQPLIIVSYKHFDNELKDKFTRLFKENGNDIDEDDELLPYFTDEYLEKERNLDYLHDCFTRFCGDIFTQKL
ncbi:leucine carboxyl methyltransferase, putative [Theileria annulata]|uniref:[phosphatase 2A protein]-leucine-carboxy methyltransferase n=1 Tax=Theileria annulata TaxID=5874 RepID=Q4UAG6_THEAN|nr:leucine carboxyl methyltransferase, putative [Theileria annulata]CAI76185.1 leucine carboxyl methyltransferase, putative [Theileria annulata]|eukprot:XP_952810.1 leucine carboxyl methyltransferase, putative [Theileria annulata]